MKENERRKLLQNKLWWRLPLKPLLLIMEKTERGRRDVKMKDLFSCLRSVPQHKGKETETKGTLLKDRLNKLYFILSLLLSVFCFLLKLPCVFNCRLSVFVLYEKRWRKPTDRHKRKLQLETKECYKKEIKITVSSSA